MSHVSLYTEVSGPHYGKGAIVYFYITVVSRPPCDHWVLTCALYDIQFFLIEGSGPHRDQGAIMSLRYIFIVMR